MLIGGTFNSRTLANMNAALDRVCEQAAHGEKHPVRKRVARQIIKCARSGKTMLGELMAAGQRGLITLHTDREGAESVAYPLQPEDPASKAQVMSR
jgi:hypothetical protein